MILLYYVAVIYKEITTTTTTRLLSSSISFIVDALLGLMLTRERMHFHALDDLCLFFSNWAAWCLLFPDRFSEVIWLRRILYSL